MQWNLIILQRVVFGHTGRKEGLDCKEERDHLTIRWAMATTSQGEWLQEETNQCSYGVDLLASRVLEDDFLLVSTLRSVILCQWNFNEETHLHVWTHMKTHPVLVSYVVWGMNKAQKCELQCRCVGTCAMFCSHKGWPGPSARSWEGHPKRI
jgi:hypothetical protein